MAFDAQIACLTIYAEASGATPAEMEAVACVIRNRAREPERFGRTVAAVCLAHAQFSSWNGDAGDRANLLRAAVVDDNDRVFNQCKVAWAWSGQAPDVTRGATHYHDTGIDPPAWTHGARLTLATERFRFYAGVQ